MTDDGVTHILNKCGTTKSSTLPVTDIPLYPKVEHCKYCIAAFFQLICLLWQKVTMYCM